MKRMIFSFSFLLYVAGAYAQITLEECQRKTQDNYPLVHQYGLVEKTKEYNLEKGNRLSDNTQIDILMQPRDIYLNLLFRLRPLIRVM